MAIFIESFSVTQLILCCCIVYVAAIVQMSVGMGFGMLASPLIAVVKPDIVPVSVMLVGLFVAVSGAWRERGNISMNELKLGVGGRIVGSAIAATVLMVINDVDGFFVVFGSMMLLAILLTISGIQIAFTARALLGLSVLSGVMGTITAVGAPPMAVIYHNRPPSVVRPTLNAFFASGCILGLISLGLSGWIDWEDFFFAAFMLPAMVAGIISSTYFMKLPVRLVSRSLLGLSAAASILLIIRGLF